ncbi:hypothetical protein DIPPA_01595 [Diplonema papillatum]|nr:hypothetical protein DIPPA_01595 [Diplonema papillatum]
MIEREYEAPFAKFGMRRSLDREPLLDEDMRTAGGSGSRRTSAYRPASVHPSHGVMRKEPGKEAAARFGMYFGIAVIIESIGVVIGSLSIVGCESTGTCGASRMRGLGALGAGASAVFIVVALLRHRIVLFGWVSVAALSLSSAIRTGAEAILLAEVWQVPVLPKLSALYCHSRSVFDQPVHPPAMPGIGVRGIWRNAHKLHTLNKRSLPAACPWQRTFTFYKVKEVTALLTAIFIPLLLAAAVASATVNRSYSFRIRELLVVRRVVTAGGLLLAFNSLFEGFFLPFATVLHIPSHPFEPMSTKLALASFGALSEALAAAAAVILTASSPPPANHRDKLKICLFLIVGGSAVRFLAEAAQLFPESTWLDAGSPMVLEVFSRALGFFAAAASLLTFASPTLQERLTGQPEDFGIA